MAKNRMINTRFWIDDYISNLDPVEKLLFLYCLTNPYTDICGIYEIPLKHIALETGLDSTMVIKILKRFEEDGKMFYVKGWLGIKNFTKHQQKNPKVNIGIENGLKQAPKELIDRLSIDYGTLSHFNSNLNSNININTNKKSADKSATNKISFEPKDLETSSYLLEKIKTNIPTFKEPNVETWAEHIRLMRERDNRTYEQIKFVIDWSQQDNFWSANILSTKKLREKFDTLVAQIKRSADKNKIKKSNVIL